MNFPLFRVANVIKLRRKIYNLSVIARIPITIGRRSNLVNIKRLTLLRALPLPNSFLVRNDDNILNLMTLYARWCERCTGYRLVVSHLLDVWSYLYSIFIFSLIKKPDIVKQYQISVYFQ